MNKAYKKIVRNCIMLTALLVIVIALPSRWVTKQGLNQREYDIAVVKAEDNVLLADSPKERQAALHRIKSLHDYKKDGHINEIKDMSWVLKTLRYMLIVALFSMCFIVIRQIINETRNQQLPDENAANGSATRT